MDARRDEDNRLAVLERVASGSTGPERAGVREFCVHLPVIVEAPQVLRARDDDREQGRAPKHQCWLVVVGGAASPVPIQCANQVRIRSSRSTSSQGGPLRDKPWNERG